MKELKNIILEDNQDGTKNIHIYCSGKEPGNEKWSYCEFNLDSAKKFDYETLKEVSDNLIEAITKEKSLHNVRICTQKEYKENVNERDYTIQRWNFE